VVERRGGRVAADDLALVGRRLTTPRAAAVAGIVFSVMLTTTYVLLRLSIPQNPRDSGEWLSLHGDRVEFALWLVPFAGIAFLWFIGVVRDRLGALEDRFFSSVLFGSGLLFLAMTFIATSLAGALISAYQADPGRLIESGVYALERENIFRVLNVFGVRMAGVFMISSGTIWLRSNTMPRWLVALTYLLAVLQLLALGVSLWITIVFPAWVLIVSVHFLVHPPAGHRAGLSAEQIASP
jgi:hypothetical protein